MKLFGVMMVRNEVDILGVNLRHHFAQGVDQFLVVDNGSSDGTLGVLESFAEDGRLHWIRDAGPYNQSDITTDLAREAGAMGADWVVPIDADEFWYAPQGTLKQVLGEVTAAALKVSMTNFIQRRAQLTSTPDALRHMVYRPEASGVPAEEAQALFDAGKNSYVELGAYPKWIARPAEQVLIAMGNHNVFHVPGAEEDCPEIQCLHTPLRARSLWIAKAMDHGARAEQLGLPEDQWWQARAWYRLAMRGSLDAEWRANSYEDECLDVHGESHPLIRDTRLRDLVTPWITAEAAPNVTAMPSAAEKMIS